MSSIHHLPPQNFKEAIISAIPNCTTMLLGMMTLNLWIYGHLTLEIFLCGVCADVFNGLLLGFFYCRTDGNANR